MAAFAVVAGSAFADFLRDRRRRPGTRKRSATHPTRLNSEGARAFACARARTHDTQTTHGTAQKHVCTPRTHAHTRGAYDKNQEPLSVNAACDGLPQAYTLIRGGRSPVDEDAGISLGSFGKAPSSSLARTVSVDTREGSTRSQRRAERGSVRRRAGFRRPRVEELPLRLRGRAPRRVRTATRLSERRG